MFDLIHRPENTLGLSTFEELDKLLDSFWRSTGMVQSQFNMPSVDIYSQDEDHMVVEMQAPGMDADDIELHVRNGVLEIRGEKSEKSQEKDGKRTYMVRERSTSFARRIALPEGADADNMQAELDKGLLKITVPVQRPEAKRIPISSQGRKESQTLAARAKK